MINGPVAVFCDSHSTRVGRLGHPTGMMMTDIRAALEPTEAMIEAARRAYLDQHGDNDFVRAMLRAALASQEAAAPNYPGIPEGWKLVPVEPTEEMQRAWSEAETQSQIENYGRGLSPEDVWVIGIDAALQAKETK